MIVTVSGQIPPRKTAPRLGLGLGLALGLVGNFPRVNCPRTNYDTVQSHDATKT